MVEFEKGMKNQKKTEKSVDLNQTMPIGSINYKMLENTNESQK